MAIGGIAPAGIPVHLSEVDEQGIGGVGAGLKEDVAGVQIAVAAGGDEPGQLGGPLQGLPPGHQQRLRQIRRDGGKAGELIRQVGLETFPFQEGKGVISEGMQRSERFYNALHQNRQRIWRRLRIAAPQGGGGITLQKTAAFIDKDPGGAGIEKLGHLVPAILHQGFEITAFLLQQCERFGDLHHPGLEGAWAFEPTHESHHRTGAPWYQRRDCDAAHRLASAKPFDLGLQLLHPAQAAADGLVYAACVLNVHARRGGAWV